MFPFVTLETKTFTRLALYFYLFRLKKQALLKHSSSLGMQQLTELSSDEMISKRTFVHWPLELGCLLQLGGCEQGASK